MKGGTCEVGRIGWIEVWVGRRLDKPHKRVDAWNLAIDLVVETHQAREAFPAEERFGLTAQVRRSAVGIPSNIAEDAARKTKEEFVKSLHISQGR